jgi:rhamnosyltransferase
MKHYSSPLVSVIIPTLNAGDDFARLLGVIRTQQIPGSMEIIVIDSGSRDDTTELAHRNGATVLCISRHQFNHSQTRNQAIEASAGKFIVLTVQDAIPVDSHWLSRLLTPHLERPKVAGSYGLQVAPPTAGLLAQTRSRLWCEANNLPLVNSIEKNEFEKMSPAERMTVIRFDNVTSCIRRTVWEKHPFPHCNYGEDMAWARKVLMDGYEIYYEPKAQIWHCHERSLLYELRRAFIDGYMRVQLADWPALNPDRVRILTMLGRIVFFCTTNKFDSMTRADEIRSFLEAEMDHCRQQKAYMYQDSLGFTRTLTEKALSMCEDNLPEKTWINMFRYAMVAMTGQHLGASAAIKQENGISKVAMWNILQWLLGRGV